MACDHVEQRLIVMSCSCAEPVLAMFRLPLVAMDQRLQPGHAGDVWENCVCFF